MRTPMMQPGDRIAIRTEGGVLVRARVEALPFTRPRQREAIVVSLSSPLEDLG